MFYDTQWVSAWSGEPGRAWRCQVLLRVRSYVRGYADAKITDGSEGHVSTLVAVYPSSAGRSDLRPDDHHHAHPPLPQPGHGSRGSGAMMERATATGMPPHSAW